jgi:hypothetical protein
LLVENAEPARVEAIEGTHRRYLVVGFLPEHGDTSIIAIVK